MNINALKRLISDWNLEFGSRLHGKKLRQNIKDFCNDKQFKSLEGAALADALFKHVKGFSSGYAISADLEKLLVRTGVLPVVELEKQYYAHNVYTLKMSGGSPKPMKQLKMWQDIKNAMDVKEEQPQRSLNLKKESIRLCEMVNSNKSYNKSEFITNIKSWLYQYIQSNADSYKRKLAFGALYTLVQGGELNVEVFYHCCLIRDSFTERDSETQRKLAVPKNKLGMIAIALAKALDSQNFTSHLENNYQVYVPNKAENTRHIALYIRRQDLIGHPLPVAEPVVDAKLATPQTKQESVDDLPVATRVKESKTLSKRAIRALMWQRNCRELAEATEQINALAPVPLATLVTENADNPKEKVPMLS